MDKTMRFTIKETTDVKTFMNSLFSRRISVLIRLHGGQVLVNGQTFKGNVRLCPNDEVSIFIPETSKPYRTAKEVPIKVLYKDEDFLVLFKPKGVPSMPTHGHYDDNLLAGLTYLFPKETFRIVTRLDKDTSGLTLVALNGITHSLLSDGNDITKIYTATLTGKLERETFVDAPILSKPLVMKRTIDENGKQAKTLFTPLRYDGSNTVCKVKLFTGRTHQIRLHAAHIGHPVVGDTLYGNYEGEYNGGQMLECSYISFINPYTNELMEFDLNSLLHN